MRKVDSEQLTSKVKQSPVYSGLKGRFKMAEKMETGCAACEMRSKHRDEKEYKALITRLNRIEGQIRGVKKMVEEDRYCIDIINQVAAVSAAINSFNKVLLSEHIKSCVVEDIKEGNSQMVDELCGTLHKLMR